MVNTGLNKLEILVNELKSLVDSLMDVVDRKEIESWMDMMAKEQGKVIEVGDRVGKWLVAEGTREGSSGCTRTSRYPEQKSTMQLTVDLMLAQSELEKQLGICDSIGEVDDAQVRRMEL